MSERILVQLFRASDRRPALPRSTGSAAVATRAAGAKARAAAIPAEPLPIPVVAGEADDDTHPDECLDKLFYPAYRHQIVTSGQQPFFVGVVETGVFDMFKLEGKREAEDGRNKAQECGCRPRGNTHDLGLDGS